MEKPSFKKIVVMNVIINLPISAALTISTNFIIHEPIGFHTFLMVLFSFALACILNVILPIPKIAQKTALLFHANPSGFAGRLIGNIPVCLIFITIIGFICTAVSVKIPSVILPAFLGAYIPHFIVCYIVSNIVVPLAEKVTEQM